MAYNRNPAYYLFCFLLLANGAVAFAQSDSVSAQLVLPDPLQYYDLPSYPIEAGKKYNSPADYGHPDFGKMTFGAPYGKNVVEVISKRTLVERHYIDLDEPTFFYIEKASQPINFYSNGVMLAIDPSLHKAIDGQYYSGSQPVPTALNITEGRSTMFFGHEEFRFNQLKAKMVAFDDSFVIYDANWSNVTVGNFSAYVTGIFPGIDLKLTYRQAGVKSEYIINSNPGLKEIIFMDELDLPDNWILTKDETDPILGLFVQVVNTITGETEIVFDPARSVANTSTREAWLNPYTINGNTVEILCDSALLNKAGLVYPLSVDPLITAVGPVTSAFGIRGSLLSPASCNHTITVTYPGGSTPWDVSASWSVYADFCARTWVLFGIFDACWMVDAQVWLTSTCGGVSPVGAPGTVWTCPGCNASGTWGPTLPFNSSGTQSLAQCYAPSCANVNRSFTIRDNRVYCTSLAPYDDCVWANSYCVSLDQWSVTVQGKTLETLGNTATGNGSTTINDADCIGTSVLNPTPTAGVPGYTYNWSTGATSPTITVPNTPAVYTCTVTDACGTSRVATFNMGCPLPVRLDNFNAGLVSDEVVVSWETLSEINSDYFLLERSGSDGTFETITKIDAQENSSERHFYNYTDKEPLTGLSYYRLAMYDLDGGVEYSETKSVLYTADNKEVLIVPNPNSGKFQFICSSDRDGEAIIEIYGPGAQLMKSETISLVAGTQTLLLDYSNLPKGVYVLKYRTAERVVTERLVIQ